ncbi:hypothetical protein NKH74_14870 [Mesorhizobium sp. M0933]|uniref:hypothetical protein n=1 Tax=Mesorhizobium sp. M0933 TaxID=2957030 RepID=UPI00333DB722
MTVVPMPKKKPTTAVAQPYEPTPREIAAREAHKERRASGVPAPNMKVTMVDKENGQRQARLEVDHPDMAIGYDLISEAIASESASFLHGTIDALAMVAQQGKTVNEGHLNYALSIVTGLKPKDQIEATLGVQMAAIHLATLAAAVNMAGAATWELKEMQERALNRLARTFVAQVEALKRYRSKGEQRVIVERVNVEKGGQAIVGNVAHGAG